MLSKVMPAKPWLRNQLVSLMLIFASTSLIWFTSLSFDFRFPPKTGERTDHLRTQRVMHHFLSQHCYDYQGLEALNTCCMMQDYPPPVILECANNSKRLPSLNQRFLNEKQEETEGEEEKMNGERNTTGAFWMMVGDSHIRGIFDTLVLHLNSPRLKYRIESYEKDGWRDIEILFATRRTTYHGKALYVKHLDIPLLLVYHWDPILTRLPEIFEEYFQPRHFNETETLPYGFHFPNLLVTGACLHWIKNTSKIFNNQGPLAAELIYEQHLEGLRPLLERIAETSTVIFKLQDHLQDDPHDVPCNTTFIDHYNSIAERSLSGGNVIMWNSTIPLSDIYAKECVRGQPTVPPPSENKSKVPHAMRQWKCEDKKHVGNVMVDQYVTMLLNEVCNRQLSLPVEHCS